MHEMSLMAGVFELIEQTVRQHNIKRVVQVNLQVGEFTNTEPGALQMAFEAYTLGTCCEGAELIVTRVPARGFCLDCKQEFALKHFFICPQCQNRQVRLTQGQELLLESLEVE